MKMTNGRKKKEERRLIAKYRETHKLLNVADGGNAPKSNAETNRKNIVKTMAEIEADPRRKRLHELKKRMGTYIYQLRKIGEHEKADAYIQNIIDRLNAKKAS